MSSRLKNSQIIALCPNQLSCHSSTLPSSYKPTYFAFACESLINIYNRIDFTLTVISAPDTTSPIVCIAFSGTNYLFCVNEKGILFVYSFKSLTNNPINSLDLQCTPVSLVSSNKILFYICNNTLFSISIDDLLSKKKEPQMLTKPNEETNNELSISPCGRALSSFKIGETKPEIWFSPFRPKQFVTLPIQSELVGFQWGLSESLICLTATKDGLVRIWTEQSDTLSLHQTAWFHFDSPIIFTTFSIPMNDNHQPQNYHSAQASNNFIYPSYNTYPYYVFVGCKGGQIHLLKENHNPQLNELQCFSLGCNNIQKEVKPSKILKNSSCINDVSFNGDEDLLNDESFRYYSIADFREDYIEHQFKMLITLTLFSKKSLSFHYIELGGSTALSTVPYRVSFLPDSIESILTNNNNDIITKTKTNSSINWSISTIENSNQDEFLFVYHNYGIQLNNKNLSLTNLNNKAIIGLYSFDFVPSFWHFQIQNSQLMCLFASTEKSLIVFINKVNEDQFKFKSYQFDESPSIEIKQCAFHSTDIFAVSSNEVIQIYFYQNGLYFLLSQIKIVNSNILFLPKMILAVSTNTSLNFYSLTSKDLVEILSIKSTPITAMNYINSSLIIATHHALFRIYLKKDCFPLPLDINDGTVFLTTLSVCNLSVIQDFVNGIKPTVDTFITHLLAESFHLNDNIRQKIQASKNDRSIRVSDLPYFDEFYQLLPLNWTNVDGCGMRFMFSSILLKLFECQIQKRIDFLSSYFDQHPNDQTLLLHSFTSEEAHRLELNLRNIHKNIKKSQSFFSIWAFLSSDQSTLTRIITFSSIQDICDSYLTFWIKNNQVLKQTINSYLSKNIPSIRASNYEIDTFLLLCIAMNKITLASKIAKRGHNEKLADFLENLERTPQSKIEKSAYAALSQHRYSLASLFFLLKGMTDQAITTLRSDETNPLLQVLLARLVNYPNWLSLMSNDEKHFSWWSSKDSPEKVLDYVLNYQYEAIEIDIENPNDYTVGLIQEISLINDQMKLIVNSHKYELLEKLKFKSSRRFLFDLQQIPYLILTYLKDIRFINSIRTNKEIKDETNEDKPQSMTEFSFGGIDDMNFDDYDDQSEEEEQLNQEQESHNFIETKEDKNDDFVSNLSEKLLENDFESTRIEPLSLSEEYICTLLADIYNRTYTKKTITFLVLICNKLRELSQPLHLLTMIMFSIIFSMSDFQLLEPLIQPNCDPFSIIAVLDHYYEKVTQESSDFYENSDANQLAQNVHQTKSTGNTGGMVKSRSLNSLKTFSANMNSNEQIAKDEPNRLMKKKDVNEIENPIPDFISYVIDDVKPTLGDKELVYFLAFDKVLNILNGLQTNSNPTIFTSFLHHRHRLLYRRIRYFRFSTSEIHNELLDHYFISDQTLTRMLKTRQLRTWAISVHDHFTSPFFISKVVTDYDSVAHNISDYQFEYTGSYNIKTTSSRVYDVCINPSNNHQIALAANEVVMALVSQNNLDGNIITDDLDAFDISRDKSYSGNSNNRKQQNDDWDVVLDKKDATQFIRLEEFKSPLLSLFTAQKVRKFDNSDSYSRSVRVKWPKAHTYSKNVKAKCITSHPYKELFVSGDKDGNLHLWRFHDANGNFQFNPTSSNTIKFFDDDSKMTSLAFNEPGDKVCSIDMKGRVVISDFESIQTFNVDSPYTSIKWLNDDTQFVLCSNPIRNNQDLYHLKNDMSFDNLAQNEMIHRNTPSIDNLKNYKHIRQLNSLTHSSSISNGFVVEKRTTNLQIFDVLSSKNPVATFDLGKPLPPPESTIPLAISNACVLTGYNDGSAVVFDIRSGMRIAGLPLHSQPITTVKFDNSGSFFITGSADNKVMVVEAKSFAGLEALNDVLLNYNSNSPKRGIFNVAVSKQAIIACGYSSHIHVWTKSSASPL